MPAPIGEHSAGSFKPGQSGNPKGATKGRAQGLAKRVREIVGDDGGPLAEAQWAILTRDATKLKDWGITVDEVKLRDQQAAIDWLANRGWGRAPEVQAQEGDDPLGLNDATERLLGELAKVTRLDDRRGEVPVPE